MCSRFQSTTVPPNGPWSGVSVATPYGDERMIINLFLPKDISLPYQTVIYVPGGAAVFTPSSEDFANYYEYPLFLSFLVRSGRAVVFPVYQGTFERRDDRYVPVHQGANNHAYSQFLAQLVKDFRRTVDYLEAREDINLEKLAYYGMSWGGKLGGIYSGGRGPPADRYPAGGWRARCRLARGQPH